MYTIILESGIAHLQDDSGDVIDSMPYESDNAWDIAHALIPDEDIEAVDRDREYIHVTLA